MQRWEQTYDLAPGGGVSVDQSDGLVRITGCDEPGVRVTATSEAENLEKRLHVLTDNAGLHIEVKRTSRGFFGFLRSEPPVDLVIMVPRGTPCAVDAGSGDVEIAGTRTAVQVDSGSGDVTISDAGATDLDTGSGDVKARAITGALSVDTGSGDVTVSQVGGDVRIDVGSGDVLLEKVAGTVRADTGSGDLSVADVEGSAELETGSGTVSVLRVKGRRLEVETGTGSIHAGGLDVADLSLETGSGSVEVELVQVDPSGSYRVETGSGRAEVAVPTQSGLHIDLRTQSGRIRHEGLALQAVRMEDDRLTAELNGGGARLSVETGSGGISLVPAGESGT